MTTGDVGTSTLPISVLDTATTDATVGTETYSDFQVNKVVLRADIRCYVHALVRRGPARADIVKSGDFPANVPLAGRRFLVTGILLTAGSVSPPEVSRYARSDVVVGGNPNLFVNVKQKIPY